MPEAKTRNGWGDDGERVGAEGDAPATPEGGNATAPGGVGTGPASSTPTAPAGQGTILCCSSLLDELIIPLGDEENAERVVIVPEIMGGTEVPSNLVEVAKAVALTHGHELYEPAPAKS